MTIMRDLVTILDGPCASIELTSSFEPLTLSPGPFVIRYFVCPRFDRRYPIPSSSLLLTNIFTHPVILKQGDLVTRLQTLWCNITEWARVSICHSDGQILSWSISDSSTYLLWNTQYAPLWLPYYSVTVDTLKASSEDSNYIWSLRSKDRVTTLLSYRNVELCDWITLQYFDFDVRLSYHSPNDMTLLSTDVCVSMIRKPWSSIAQWTSMLELTRDLVVYILHVY